MTLTEQRPRVFRGRCFYCFFSSCVIWFSIARPTNWLKLSPRFSACS
nr:MAG TPA: hypothetical protein [Caudoviricetes sp.]